MVLHQTDKSSEISLVIDYSRVPILLISRSFCFYSSGSSVFSLFLQSKPPSQLNMLISKVSLQETTAHPLPAIYICPAHSAPGDRICVYFFIHPGSSTSSTLPLKVESVRTWFSLPFQTQHLEYYVQQMLNIQVSLLRLFKRLESHDLNSHSQLKVHTLSTCNSFSNVHQKLYIAATGGIAHRQSACLECVQPRT